MSGVLNGKLAFIGGASGVIGSAVAKRFAREGSNLILSGKNIKKLQKLDDEIRAEHDVQVVLVELDVLKPLAIRELALSIASKFEKLDIVVSAISLLGDLSPLHDYDEETWRDVMTVNLDAHWSMIKYMDPLLKKSDAGRLIFVTSEITAHPAQHPYWGAYMVSKAGLRAMVEMYSAEIRHSKVCANLVYPTDVASKIYMDAFPGREPESLPKPEDLTDSFVELASPECTLNGVFMQLKTNIHQNNNPNIVPDAESAQAN